jgi:hypothetical protein
MANGSDLTSPHSPRSGPFYPIYRSIGRVFKVIDFVDWYGRCWPCSSGGFPLLVDTVIAAAVIA